MYRIRLEFKTRTVSVLLPTKYYLQQDTQILIEVLKKQQGKLDLKIPFPPALRLLVAARNKRPNWANSNFIRLFSIITILNLRFGGNFGR